MTTAPDPQSEDVLSRPSPPPAATRSYGPDPAQVYDVRLPPPGVTPVGATVVVVHGGFWRPEYDRTHAGPEAQAFADAGFHVAVAEYRRAGMPGGGVPGTLDDVRAVVAAVARDPQLPGPVVLVGHSAGGQLVAWAAGQQWSSDPALRLAGVVSLAGVVDLHAADRMDLGAGAVRSFAGDPASDRAAWDLADPMTSLPPRVPVRLVNASEDDVVPASVADAYVARARAAGGDVSVEVVPAAGHFSLIDPEQPAFARVVAAVRSLVP
ncbi:alpha/beta hydrolase family protein [Intrasporangium oryzae]|uniref:alpha/beta hydrolase family protein n=1 Tax=Intrasporangium oryzae TaxID=412687 RepID=UPI0004AF95C8|nr:alpha/beta hydrolase [Intrasporangium oryzae]